MNLNLKFVRGINSSPLVRPIELSCSVNSENEDEAQETDCYKPLNTDACAVECLGDNWLCIRSKIHTIGTQWVFRKIKIWHTFKVSRATIKLQKACNTFISCPNSRLLKIGRGPHISKVSTTKSQTYS